MLRSPGFYKKAGYCWIRLLALNDPHKPAGKDSATREEDEAFCTVEDHVARGGTLSDPEDDGGKEGEDDRCAEMRELHGYSFFPIAMSYASTALITFSKPATIMNFVP